MDPIPRTPPPPTSKGAIDRFLQQTSQDPPKYFTWVFQPHRHAAPTKSQIASITQNNWPGSANRRIPPAQCGPTVRRPPLNPPFVFCGHFLSPWKSWRPICCTHVSTFPNGRAYEGASFHCSCVPTISWRKVAPWRGSSVRCWPFIRRPTWGFAGWRQIHNCLQGLRPPPPPNCCSICLKRNWLPSRLKAEEGQGYPLGHMHVVHPPVSLQCPRPIPFAPTGLVRAGLLAHTCRGTCKRRMRAHVRWDRRFNRAQGPGKGKKWHRS